MDRLNPNDKQDIVKEELKKLVYENLISESIYQEVLNGHRQYYNDLAKKERIVPKEKEQVEKSVEQPIVKQPVQPKKEKKVLTPQQIRERNITWALNLGVILLLLGGLVLATSTWETLGNWTKTGMIALVSVLFFGLAWISKRVLNIEKTAYAFVVLGSLFLPIVLISAGYFQLFGTYFSFFGEGRYIYGALGSLAILPLYLYFSYKLGSRLFVWFSYMTISVFVSFVIGALYLPIDGFYLGLMVYNAVLMFGYGYLKKHKLLQAFTKEFIPFIQANLILSTLFMLFFSNHELLYSFNLMLTAVLYLAMIYVTNQKSYHFVFTVMLVYGVYQLIEFAGIHEVGNILYALLGFLFIVIPKWLQDRNDLKKSFQYTSAIVSFLAFIYISFEGILLRMNEASIVLVIAYIIISLNFLFLSNLVKQRLFMYLSPIFMVTALFEIALLGEVWFGYEKISLPLFGLNLLLYIGIGCLIRTSFFRVIKQSTRDISSVIMLICLLASIQSMDWWHVATMLLLLSFIGLWMEKFEDRPPFIALAPWIHAIGIALSIVSLYASFIYWDWMYVYIFPLEAEGYVLGSLVLLGVSFLWRYVKQTEKFKAGFFSAQIIYGYGMLLTIFTEEWMRVIILIGGVGMAYLLYRKTKWSSTPFVMSGLTLVSYFALLIAVHNYMEQLPDYFNWLQFALGTVLLLITSGFFNDKDTRLMKAYQWVGHLYMPFALLISLFLYEENAVWSFLVATIIYGVTTQFIKHEWLIRTFLYACFTSFWSVISLLIWLIEYDSYSHYGFLITSVVIAFFYYISKPEWNKRITYYLVPFSSIGIAVFTGAYPIDLTMLVVTILYAIGLLVILHKQMWTILNVIPLMLVFISTQNFGYERLGWEGQIILIAAFAVILIIVGFVMYPSIIEKSSSSKLQLKTIDWYSIVGLFVLFILYEYSWAGLWTRLLPGILISIYIVLQRNRIPLLSARWFIFAGGIYLLQPYYVLLDHYALPELFERELYVLPWVIYIVLLKKIITENNKALVNNIQWVVLVIVSLLLVQDGLASNTIYDALIVGGLSLASMVGGMVYQLKSFFFIGAGVLLLNVFLQTRPYWGNLPWWGYLLIAGSILISVASYNEWHKQKTSDGKETLLTKFNRKVVQKVRKWE
ncbi:hypothetical protein GMD78_10620 [Ornithinibacillus sp. L9]|uniref:DUF2157 domain-containing protein n=1 Tax=Ornithinibacillus caprae TaxID=2678566 RepID=A0A6N8FHC5_9BACI|nr:hypothetical protein [Ornithinibacillus caprae]MUK88845.1 hypothetical protein [Ornithinibacillus caprae]